MADYTPTLIPLAAQGVNPSTTPLALKAQRDYANALLYGKMQQPVQHWTQGVSNMVSALMGGQLDYNAAQKERQGMGDVGRGLNVDIGGPTGAVSQKMSFTDAPSGEGDTNTAGGGDMAARKAAIASIESGSPEGNYSAIGPVVKAGSYAGDRAFGKYQVMGKNIPVWTKEVFGQSMTPEQFLKNPQAQEAIFEAKSTNNPRDWFGHGKSDGYMSGANYEKKYAEGLRKYGGGQPAMAFSGDSAEAAGPAAIAAAALRGGNSAPTMRREQAMPVGGGTPLVDPDTVPRQPRISKQDFQAIQANPFASDAQKAMAFQIYMQQNQPVTVPVPGGSVVVSPYDPRVQRANPEVRWSTKKLPGGLEKESPSTVRAGPNGEIIQTPATQVAPVGPRSEADSPVAPAAAPQGGPAATPAPVQAAAQAVPLPTPRPPEAPVASALAAAPNVQVASLDPTAGIAKAAEPPLTPREQEMMALVKPAAPTAPATPAATPPAVQTAEAGFVPPTNPLAQAIRTKPPSSDYTDEEWKSITGYQDLERQNAIDKEAGLKGVDASMKKYDTLSTQASNARKLLPNIDIAQSLMNDPNFDSGITANISLAYNKVRAAFPSLFGKDAQYAAAPNEVFNKVVAGSILDNMRTALAGLGQVRIAEIDLLKQASASQNNTPAANRALLELSRRSLTQLDRIDQMAQAYQSGDEVVNPVTGVVMMKANMKANGEVEPRRGLDVGFDKLARKFVNENPTTTPEEAVKYKELFSAGKAGAEPSAAPKPGAALPVEIPPEAIGALKAGKPTTFQNGQVYTLGPDGKPQRLK